MGKTIKVDTGIQTYTFTDQDDHVFASFRLNPTDINLARRAMEIGEKYENRQGLAVGSINGIDEAAALNKEIEDDISYVLGYDASDIFGEVTATTIFADGTVFAYLVLDRILEEVNPAIKERTEKMEQATDKYLKKYQS